MEEEHSDNELEEKLYAMLHHVDETDTKVDSDQNDLLKIVENAPASTVRRYWRSSNDLQPSTHAKSNVTNDSSSVNNKNNCGATCANKGKQKQQVSDAPAHNESADLSIFQSPIPSNITKSIEIVEHQITTQVVELVSSDEDEVIEVALPPKPTITIESSDDEALVCMPQKHSTANTNNYSTVQAKFKNRDISSSPVPSTVSSVSDEFIRSDCIALNISSRNPVNHSFDFGLHGTDLIEQSTPMRKKKKKRNKDHVTSTPESVIPISNKKVTGDECFATPKDKGKQKSKKSPSTVDKSSQGILDDSDSNQSLDNNSKHSYVVTDRSFPSVDVYESDSNQSETVMENKDVDHETCNSEEDKTSESTVLLNKEVPVPTVNPIPKATDSPDLNDEIVILNESIANSNIVMANISGFIDKNDATNNSMQSDVVKFGSTKIPSILYEDLDFDNLKGKADSCRVRKYSLTTLRAEMDKFYNESWGGENFNHRELQKHMSRDKSLWAIDPKDRMPVQYRKKTTCNYCNRPGHRHDMCKMRPPVCYMCGATGHFEPRCPRKICVNCGSPNFMYSTMCRNCSSWYRIICPECGQYGHPSSHCPDIWRRYHNTIDINVPLAENHFTKNHHQLFCSGCTRRGHLVHTCRISLPFSGLPINSPYVSLYRPMYFSPMGDNFHSETPQEQQFASPLESKNDQQMFNRSPNIPYRNKNKRASKSPTVHDTHVNKKRSVSVSESNKVIQNPISTVIEAASKEVSDGQTKQSNNIIENNKSLDIDPDKAPDFIPIDSTNHDKRGHVIQDNEVSDTSEIVTSARILVGDEVFTRLKTVEGEEWLKEISEYHNVLVEITNVNTFITVKGKIGDQEGFQSDLRSWSKDLCSKEETISVQDQQNNIPKNKNCTMKKIKKALEALKEDLGDPGELYKELLYLRNHHEQLLHSKVVSPIQLSNNRDHIKQMLKKLNMVLLGQAGLADGLDHLNELHCIQDKLANIKNKYISISLRKEIGAHFHCIFTGVARNDYEELLQKYYLTKQLSPIKKTKKKKNKFRQSFGKKNMNFVSTGKKFEAKTNVPSDNMTPNPKKTQYKTIPDEKTVSDLHIYHKKLIRARPMDACLKKARNELIRRVHSHIASLRNNKGVSSKSIKKMKKTQEKAQQFLSTIWN